MKIYKKWESELGEERRRVERNEQNFFERLWPSKVHDARYIYIYIYTYVRKNIMEIKLNNLILNS